MRHPRRRVARAVLENAAREPAQALATEPAPIGHNNPPEPPPAPTLPQSARCALCRHWNPPSEAEESAYRAFALGVSKRRVREPSGSCDRVMHRPGGPLSFAGTLGRSRCFNFEEKPPERPRRGAGFVTIYEGNRVVWQGREGEEPARFRPGYAERRAQLDKMTAAHSATAHELAAIRAQLAELAHRHAMSESRSARQFGRHSTTWTGTDERTYQAWLVALTAIRAPELRALSRRLERQDGAIATFRKKHGIKS
ncbi:MAG: hypothetical protein M0R03_18670 [Novosphingobium sp.]|nr:hypothetical protein [Novosphingobium sp.]